MHGVDMLGHALTFGTAGFAGDGFGLGLFLIPGEDAGGEGEDQSEAQCGHDGSFHKKSPKERPRHSVRFAANRGAEANDGRVFQQRKRAIYSVKTSLKIALNRYSSTLFTPCGKIS